MTTTRSDETMLRLAVVALAVVVLAPLLAMAVAMLMLGMMGYWYGGMGMTPGTGGVGTVFGVVPLLGALLVVVALVVLFSRTLTGASSAGTDPALEALHVAYARSDLTEEKFEPRRERLESREGRSSRRGGAVDVMGGRCDSARLALKPNSIQHHSHCRCRAKSRVVRQPVPLSTYVDCWVGTTLGNTASDRSAPTNCWTT